MKYRAWVITLNYAIMLLLSVLFIMIFTEYRRQQKYENYREIRFKSIALAEELRVSSENLTKYCRTYVITGDSIWEKKYWEVLDIRNGIKLRPDGATIALRDSMKSLGFTDLELDKFKEAEDNSNRLIYNEKSAFNAMKGLFADSTGAFTIKAKPDIELARRIMFDSLYHADKRSIMEPIDDFILHIQHRTEKADEKNYKESKHLMALILQLAVLISLLSVFSFTVIRKDILRRIKDLKKYRQAINESEEKFRTIFETSLDSVVICREGKILFSNKTFIQMLELDRPEDIVGRSFAEFIAPQKQAAFKAYIERTEAAEPTQELHETVGVRKSGMEFPLEIGVGSYVLKHERYKVGVIHDISKRKRNEQALLESNEKFSVAFYKSSVAKSLTSFPDGVFVDVNDAFTEMSGYARDELVNSSSTALNIWANLTEREHFVRSVNEEGGLVNQEFLFKDKTGHLKNCILSSTILHISDKKYLLSSVIDITQQKEAEFQLKKLNATKDKFFSIISHDLKNPFTSLLSISELMAGNYSDIDDEDKEEGVKRIYESATRIYNLLENLLTWSRAQSDRLSFNPGVFLLNEIIDENLSLHCEIANKKKITLQAEPMPELHAYGDRDMIDTVFRNLLGNAIKFTPTGKSVRIKVDDEGALWKVNVLDEGVGMSVENQEKIFHIETKFKTDGTSGEKGTGLGLLICKEFISKNGGTISVRSELGKGSAFSFTIPKQSGFVK